MPRVRDCMILAGLLILCGCGGPRGMVEGTISQVSTLRCTPEHGWQDVTWKVWQLKSEGWMNPDSPMVDIPETETAKPWEDGENLGCNEDLVFGPRPDRWDTLCDDGACTDYYAQDLGDRWEHLCGNDDGDNETCDYRDLGGSGTLYITD